MYTSTGKYAKR